jgi:hypothetical protein
MKVQLRKVVPDVYWKKAEAYLTHFLEEKSKPGTQSTGAPFSSSAVASSSTGSSHDGMKRTSGDLQRPQEAQRGPREEPNTANLSLVRDDQAKKRPHVASSSALNKATTLTKTATMYSTTKEKAPAKGRAKGASTPTSQQQRKPSLSASVNADSIVPPVVAPTPTAPPAPVVRDYNELMEHVDHAFAFDWTVAGSLLGESTYATLNEEQQHLVYDSLLSTNAADKGLPIESEGVSFPLEGWSRRNVVSSRVAWARLRFGKKDLGSSAVTSNPVVASGLLGITLLSGKKPISIEGSHAADYSEIDTVWYNDEKAEEDIALAVLSEGAEIYLKSVLEKALHSARQRQNIDGVRLWHQQFTRGELKPTLSLRLGCDVERQVAQVAGNAAITCKRMEEARERQSNIPTRDLILNDHTLTTATS